MQISIIVAMTPPPQRLIGSRGGLPWHFPEDLKHFKERTLGHALIMGRKTFASLKGPLPKRRNLIVSRQPNPNPPPGVEWFTSLQDAIDAAQQSGESELFIAGGSEIYALALPLATRLYFTFIHGGLYHGDTFFPPWDPAQWKLTSQRTSGPLEFLTYDRT